ncbi:MAG: secretin and TonB N-terminal domain-containing protein [Burkholderiales bacterium]|nr:secretin and TonB N-terminal domain-containing protein [Burkholderiales bacterium]
MIRAHFINARAREGGLDECSSSRPTFFRMLAWLCAIFLLAGCAAQMAYKDGKDLVAQDKIELGLLKFREAMAADPSNAEYRVAFTQTRERAVNAYVAQADALAQAGKSEHAEALYQRALGIDAGNERARAGLQALGAAKRHAQWLQEAQSAYDRQDMAGAQLKLNMILAENPQHATAAAMKRSLTERAVKPSVEASLADTYKKPISIEFRDAQLRQVFEVVAMSAGLNFVFDKDVKTDQKTSIFLKNSTVESAIHMLLLTNQLESQVLDANTILIYPNTPAKQKDYQELVVKSFFLTNADAKTVATTLKTIIKSKDIVTDEKLNMVIVRDSPEAIRLAEKLVALHDAPEPEVMLEVEILEVKRSRLLNLGIQWPGTLSLTPLGPADGSPFTLEYLRRGISDGRLGAAIGGVTVRAQKDDTDTNLLANPRIRARNREKAKIVIGEKVPIISTTTGFTGSTPVTSETITYVDVGLKLDVEPTVHLDNDVAIKVGLEVSNLGAEVPTKSGSVAYRIGNRNANTVLRLKDGETQVLAGLINDEDRKSASKIPGLGDMPILGRLFGSSLDNNDKTEIVLSITPRIIRNIQRPSAFATEFRSGTETNFRSAPDSSNRGPAAGVTPQGRVTVGASSGVVPAAVVAAPPAANNAPAGTAPSTAPAAPDAGGKGVYMQWTGPNLLKVGDPFDMHLVLESKQALSGLALTLSFDTKALQLVGISEGDFLKQGGAQTTFNSQVDQSGKISVQAKRDPAGVGGATGPALPIVASFRAMAPSEAAKIDLLSISATDTAGRNVALPSIAPHAVRIHK